MKKGFDYSRHTFDSCLAVIPEGRILEKCPILRSSQPQEIYLQPTLRPLDFPKIYNRHPLPDSNPSFFSPQHYPRPS